MKQFIVDKIEAAAEKEAASFTCTCGHGVLVNVKTQPHKFIWDCPNPECGAVFEVAYVGRRRRRPLELAKASREGR